MDNVEASIEDELIALETGALDPARFPIRSMSGSATKFWGGILSAKR